MPPRYTKEEVIRDKRLGVRYFEEALTQVLRATLIHDAMAIHRNNPGVWGHGWRNFDWALGNAVRSYIRRQGDVAMTFNADEVLTTPELAYIRGRLGIIESYTPTWDRRQPKDPKAARPRKPKPVPPLGPPPVLTMWERLMED